MTLRRGAWAREVLRAEGTSYGGQAACRL